MKMFLNGKIALVTGSTQGIGLEIACQLANAGCQLMLNGIDDPASIETAKEKLRTAGADEMAFSAADLSDPAQAAVLITDTINRFGHIDILVNNAGIQHIAPVEAFTDEMWDRIVEINLSAPFRLTRQVLPAMRANAWGRIINIASVHGLVASPHKSAYVAAKHGLVGLTKTVALETAAEPITCNAVCPGYVRTALIEAQIAKHALTEDISPEDAAESILGEKQPSGNFVTPTDIGAMVSFLCTDTSAQITGSVFTIDGGWTAQ